MKKSLCRIDAFWEHHPALFVGVCFFLGASVSLGFHLFSAFDLLLLPLLFLLFPYKRLLWGGLIIFIACWSTTLRVHLPRKPLLPRTGVALAEVTDRHLVTFHGHQLWKMQLLVHQWCGSNGESILKGVTVPVCVAGPCPLVGGALYQFNARVGVDDQLRIRFRPFLGKEVPSIQETLSFVEWRLRIRRTLEKVFVRLFPDVDIRTVAGGLTFGLYKDPLLQKAMHRAGVEHVLAVSGFHFGIVCALVVFLTQRMAPKIRAALAILCLTLYLLIIGPLPSVIRAWCAAVVVLGGVCLNRRTSGINCLGVGLIVAVLYDPTSISSIGFQLSFLATAAILFFSRLFQRFFRTLFPARQMDDIVVLSKADQVVLLVFRWFIPALSLMVPVFLVLCPYQLAFLQDFSLLGLVYNLLIPTIFSLAMPAVLLAVVFSPLPLLPQVLAYVAHVPLRLGLIFVENAPQTSWSMAAGECIPPALGRILIVSVFLLGMMVLQREDEESAEAWKACL